MTFVQQYGQWYCQNCSMYHAASQAPMAPGQPVFGPQPAYGYGPYGPPTLFNPYQYPIKSEVIAILFSLLLPGLGQIYNGEIAKGLGHMVIYIALVVVCLFIYGMLCFSVLIPVVFLIFSLIDASSGSKKYNESVRMYGRPPW